jgi:hypothetical protein
MYRSLACTGLIVAASLLAPQFTHAQYPTTQRGGQVVHDRLAPVLMHRLLPPFHGKHVYRGRGR